MAIIQSLIFTSFLFVCGLAQDVPFCKSWEEGTSITNYFGCGATQNFQTFSQRPTINGVPERTGYCDFDGNCVNDDTSRFLTKFVDPPGPLKFVTLDVIVHTRDITEIHCYLNDAPLVSSNSGCRVGAYVLPQPVCTGPTFAADGQTAQVTCVADRVFPSASCGFREKTDSPPMTTGLTFESAIDDPSPTFPDDKQLTCTYTYNVQGENEGDYMWQTIFTPLAQTIEPTDAMTVADMPTLQLRTTTLNDPADNDQEHDYPEGGELTLTIPVTSSPGPTSHSLKVKYDAYGTLTAVSDYTLTFTRTTGMLDGVITLTVREGLTRSGPSYFELMAKNGVVSASSALTLSFSVVPTNEIAGDFCQRNGVGFFDHPSTCDHYVVCQGYPWLRNAPYVMPCGLGTFWDQSLLTCNHKSVVPCN